MSSAVPKISLGLLFVSSVAHAGGTAVAQQNAVSAATGGAGVARDDDAGAAWHAPAALADGGGVRIGFALALAHPALQARSQDGTWTADSENPWKTPPHLDASFARERLAAGIAIGVPFGGGVVWPATWPGSTQSVRTDLLVLRAAPFVAYRFGALRVAAGMHFDRGRLQIQRNLDFIDMQGDVRLDLAGTGMGAHASLYWQPNADAALGLAFRSRTTLDFIGNANFTTPDAFNGKTPDQRAYTQMTLPDQLVLGGRYRRDRVTILGEVEYTRWSVNRATVVDFEEDVTPNVNQPNNWQDTFTLRAGLEYVPAANDKLVIRGGGYYDPSPVPAEHLTPTSPDSTRVAMTAGASYRITPAWAADLFAEQMWLLRRDTTSIDTMPASYGGTAMVVGAGVRWTPSR
jgi:long-chain fatty acid transport protein